jgi:isoleucyl-tRNA synthetase
VKAGSKRYTEYKSIDLGQVGKEVLEFWQQQRIFQRSVDEKAGSASFTFYEGPPSANGTPGIHHVMARTVKDIFCRYKTMKGYHVKRKGGWDTHGLPVELQVEKELGITKDDIGKKISVAEYNRKCREAVMKYKDDWDLLTEKMGFWVDLDDPYVTFERTYMETVWYLLKSFYDKGLLYKGYTIQPYSPAAGTGLSSHELNQPGCYRMVKDTSVVAQFEVVRNEQSEFLYNCEQPVCMLAWTTTPWTLPANSALAIGPKISYVLVSTFNQYTHKPVQLILAKDLVGHYFKANDVSFDDYRPGDKQIPFSIIKEFKGRELEGIDYHQLMPYVPLPKPAFTVVAGDFVTTEEGTGIVHISKTFGADDYRTCVQYGIPGVTVKDVEGKEVPIVDKKGRFVEEITDFAGMYVKNYEGRDENDPEYKSTDVLISIKLKEENKAFKVEKYEHSYPHCWRTDKPVLYYPLDSWFIKTTAYKERLVELNQTINWKPASTGTGRFGNWLENLVDWNLSRSRFWGTPLPIWRTEDGREERCIGSFDELCAAVDDSIAKGFMKEPLPEDFDLHRPYVDEVILVSEKGEKMYRETDLIDVWFDSGAMPYAQWHFPFENQEEFEAAFPADYIAEGVDQTRGWFFTLHAIAGMLFDSVAFKNVIANGLVLDKNGNKMSKRLGNTVDPFKTIDELGADATGWYMISNANPWDNLKFDIAGVREIQRRFFGTLQNTYAFFALYANIDGFKFTEDEVDPKQLKESDRWILSRLNSLIKAVDLAYSEYEPTKATRAIQGFVVDDLSNWYVRLNRKRFWNPASLESNDSADKVAAYQTLYQCLNVVAKLSAAVAPFYSDHLYRDLNNVSQKEVHESIHLSQFPEVDETKVDLVLEEKMELAQQISSLVHSLRKKHRIKVRQPLTKVLIPILRESTKNQIEAVEDLIKWEVNVKAVEYVDDTSGILVKKAKPNFRKLGQQYGPLMKELSKKIENFHHDEIQVLERGSQLEIHINDQTVYLTEEDVEIVSEDIPGWSVASDGTLTVALDITITEDLKQEGIARDVVNRVQNLRKEMGLDVQDKINIVIEKNNNLVNSALQANQEYICQETQALSLEIQEELDGGKLLEMDDIMLKVKIGV